MLGVIIVAMAVGALFFSARGNHDPAIYSPRLAWIRAWVYYCFVILFSWVTGVLGYILERPLIAPGRLEDSTWLILVTLCWLVVKLAMGATVLQM